MFDGVPPEMLYDILERIILPRVEALGWHRGRVKHCFDFPSHVLHYERCPRLLSGADCHPLPMPQPPLDDEAKAAYHGYMVIMVATRNGDLPGLGRMFTPDGTTVLPDGVVAPDVEWLGSRPKSKAKFG